MPRSKSTELRIERTYAPNLQRRIRALEIAFNLPQELMFPPTLPTTRTASSEKKSKEVG